MELFWKEFNLKDLIRSKNVSNKNLILLNAMKSLINIK